MGEIWEGPSRNKYKGHMDKAEGGRFEVGDRDGWRGGRGWEKMETIVLK